VSSDAITPVSRRPGTEVGISFEVEMVMKVRAVLESHAEECPQEPKVILLNPGNHELLGWDEMLGLPVLPDERAKPGHARLVCGIGKAGYCEDGQVVWDENGNAWVFVPSDDS
jgi:hypothetical protein